MARPRDPKRERAWEIYKEHNGKIDLVEIASQLSISPGTVRGWKSKESWDSKLNGAFQKNTERSKRSDNKNNEYKKVIAEEVKQVVSNPELTDKQRLFCLYYVRYFNATKSAVKAGYSSDTAMEQGYQLLQKTSVRDEIQRLKQNRLNRELLSEDDIFQKYIDIAFADMNDFAEISEGMVHVKTDLDGTILSELSDTANGVKVKLADRMKALQWLSDHMDLATEEQKARIAVMKAKSQTGDEEETADDGFLDALNGTAAEDWTDEEG